MLSRSDIISKEDINGRIRREREINKRKRKDWKNEKK